MKYQQNYSQQFPEVMDEASRQRKATKILQSLKEYLQRENLKGLRCLDLGCSVGVISDTLAHEGASVVGLDIDGGALGRKSHRDKAGAEFVLGDGGATPFMDGVFDLVVCAQVYEHAPSLELLAQEVHRLLKTGGVCFFSGPNRWAIIEEHYDLPFLSWLPRRWADQYVRLTRHAAEYYEQPRSAAELRKALQGFTIHDLAPKLLTHPERYSMEREVGVFRYLARCVPKWNWLFLGSLLPNFNWLLVKTKT
jgi:2-polyprenyl-3-methyl-5-hydroxy-6-metoxy-1,4-benzoquinol methylase